MAAEGMIVVTQPEPALIEEQLEKLVRDELLRSSRRSVGFLRYIVEEALQGRGEDLKERTIGVHVFSRPLTYDTNADHVVRTAASELRKRLSLYYGKEEHRHELRILLLPGSYVPQFQPGRREIAEEQAEVLEEAREDSGSAARLPGEENDKGATSPRPAAVGVATRLRSAAAVWVLLVVLLFAAGTLGLVLHFRSSGKPESTAQQLFWQPFFESSGPILIAVGDVPHGPPVISGDAQGPLPTPAAPGPPSVPFADAVTIARIGGVLEAHTKDFLIRRESASSFADLREHPAVLVGAFNNEWSLRLTHHLRFSLALDADHHFLYIRDRDHPEVHQWQWSTDPHPGEKGRSNSTPLHDYSLISRLLDSETGHNVLVVGGLYTYGTQAAGEFLTSSSLEACPRNVLQDTHHKTLQIVLDTLVVDGSAGPPKIVAVSEE